MGKPEIRFKGYTDEWEQRKLGDIASSFEYGLNAAAKEYDGENKYIRITDIDENSNRYSNKDVVSPDGILEDKFLVKENDILFARTGASTGKTYLYNSNDGKLYYAGFLIKASIINHNSNFIFQQTKLNKYNNWIRIMSMRSGQPGINSQEYGSYKFSITNIDEENKISNFLSLIDKKIELQSKKIEDLKLFKLSQSNLIKIDDSYKKISLKNILKEYNERSTINNQYEILSSTAKGIFLQSEYFNKQAASENNIGYKILRKNQLVLSPQNLWMGNININNKYEVGIVSPSYKIFDINTNVINIEYFKNWIKSPRALYEYMISSEQGASIVRRNLNMDLFNEITLSVPNMNEQNKIGKMLSLIDNKILLEEDKYKKLLELKKGLMQNMFV